jgi:hypothetical protein
LKVSADRTALRGVANFDTFNAARPGRATMNIAGMTAKLFATSLAMEKAVRARRVINICLPMATRSVSLVRSCLGRRIELGCEQRELNQVVLLTARYRNEIIRLVIAGGDRFSLSRMIAARIVETPLQTFLDAIPVAREKMTAA